MIKTKTIVTELNDIPNNWIFEYYLNLPETLNGQDINIKSMLSPKDTNPSFFIYYNRALDKYKFKDFSAGKQGDGVELVKELHNLENRFEAGVKIINDYNKYIHNNGVPIQSIFKLRPKYKVIKIKIRKWRLSDEKFWKKFKLTSKILNRFFVRPLEYFVIAKENGGEPIIIKSNKIYGYFRKDGTTIYKIYQPMLKDKKFFKISDYIQGFDQLTFKKPYLIICSSLKDAMGFTLLNFKNTEVIAPDSENVMLSKESITFFKSKYKKIGVLFDNDDAGIKSMKKYKEQFNLPSIHLKVEKDLADAIEAHGINNIREILEPILIKHLTKKYD